MTTDPELDPFASYGFAWTALKRSFVDLLVIGVIWVALSLPLGILRKVFPPLALAYGAFVLAPLAYGGLYAYLRAVRGQRPEIADLFTAFAIAYWPSVLANILVHVIVGVGFALLVVPGVIALVRLSFVPFLVIDEQRDAADAIRESWERTWGYGWQIFGVWLLAIPIVIAGAIFFGVGIVPALMWTHLAFATMYAGVTASDRGEAIG
jgi:hypothetical protein